MIDRQQETREGGVMRESSCKDVKKRKEALVCKDVLNFLVTVDIAIYELNQLQCNTPPFLPFVV